MNKQDADDLLQNAAAQWGGVEQMLDHAREMLSSDEYKALCRKVDIASERAQIRVNGTPHPAADRASDALHSLRSVVCLPSDD